MGVQIDGSTGNIIATKAEYSGNVSIAGTLTYEDVTNVDSVGLITARSGLTVSGGDVKVGSAVTISQDNIFTTGIVTATSFSGNITGATTGIVTTLTATTATVTTLQMQLVVSVLQPPHHARHWMQQRRPMLLHSRLARPPRDLLAHFHT